MQQKNTPISGIQLSCLWEGHQFGNKFFSNEESVEHQAAEMLSWLLKTVDDTTPLPYTPPVITTVLIPWSGCLPRDATAEIQDLPNAKSGILRPRRTRPQNAQETRNWRKIVQAVLLNEELYEKYCQYATRTAEAPAFIFCKTSVDTTNVETQ